MPAEVWFVLPISPPTAAPAASATAPVMTSPRLWFRRGGGGGSLACQAACPPPSTQVRHGREPGRVAAYR